MNDKTRLPEINTVVMSGRLIYDPEIKQISAGRQKAHFKIAANRRYKTQDEWKEATTYIEVETWNPNLVERIGKSLSKGSGVLVEGRVESDDWVDKDDNKRTTIRINANRVQFVDRFISASDSNDTLEEDAADKPF